MTGTEIVIGILLALAGAVAGVVIAPLGEPIRSALSRSGGELSGKWKQVIPPSSSKPYQRVDEVRVGQRGARLVALCRRIEPFEERDRSWHMRGYLSGNETVIVFWPKRGNPDGTSFGTIVLHRSSDQPEASWSGYYARPALGQTTSKTNSPQLPLVWERQ